MVCRARFHEWTWVGTNDTTVSTIATMSATPLWIRNTAYGSLDNALASPLAIFGSILTVEFRNSTIRSPVFRSSTSQSPCHLSCALTSCVVIFVCQFGSCWYVGFTDPINTEFTRSALISSSSREASREDLYWFFQSAVFLHYLHPCHPHGFIEEYAVQPVPHILGIWFVMQPHS